MLQIEELKQELLAQQPKIEYLKEALGYQKLLEQKKQLDEQAAQPDFWNDVENTKKVLKEQKTVNEKVGSYENLVRMYEDAQTMLELAAEEEFDSEEEQESFLQDIRTSLKEIAQRIEEEKLSALLSGEFDQNNAILSFPQVQAAPKRRIGCRCSTGCMPAGASDIILKSRCWIIWQERKRASKAPPS